MFPAVFGRAKSENEHKNRRKGVFLLQTLKEMPRLC